MTTSGLEEYEILGDLDAPFEVTKVAAEQRQAEAERVRRAHDEAPPRLSHDQMMAGEPCPGCRRPLLDPEPWNFRGTMHMTKDERRRYEAEESTFRELHPDCGTTRWSMSGSLTTHCSLCCPSPPLSPAQIEVLSRSARTRTSSPAHDLMRWQLRLFCGHEVERIVHKSWKSARSFAGSGACPTCGLDPAVLVDARPIGLVEEPTP